EIRNVRQPRPWPGKRRSELGKKMAHARFAAGNAVDLEQAHLRPAQAEGMADDVVEFLDRRDSVADEPERLAPKRLQEPVADEGFDFLSYHDRFHADCGIDRPCAFDG